MQFECQGITYGGFEFGIFLKVMAHVTKFNTVFYNTSFEDAKLEFLGALQLTKYAVFLQSQFLPSQTGGTAEFLPIFV